MSHELGYKASLQEPERLIQDRLLYHGRLGGALASFDDTPMFFYAEGALSSVFAEHRFINDDEAQDVCGLSNDDYVEAYLSRTPVVMPLRVNISRPVVFDTVTLMAIAATLGLQDEPQVKFVEDFEDSVEGVRNQVFEWARANGYNGAIIVNDLTPEFPGGDWFYRTSYVAFEPSTQVQFAFY